MCRRTILVVALAVGAVVTDFRTAHAANCSLRNPDRQIYELFPDATSYRSMVANVDERFKPTIEALLGSEITFNDLAKHTIFVVLKNNVPIGLIHPRSEVGAHGTVELVWALDLDFRIRDVRVQRCREKHTDVIESEMFRSALVGRDHHRLREFLLDANTRVNKGRLTIPSGSESIVHTALLCGTKTLIITEVAFGDPLSPLRLLGNVHRFFPETNKVTKLNALLSEAASAAAESLLRRPLAQVSGDSVAAARAYGSQDRPSGTVVRCQCAGLPEVKELWIAVANDEAVSDLVMVGPDDRAGAALSAFRGKPLTELLAMPTTDDALGQCVIEVLALLAARRP